MKSQFLPHYLLYIYKIFPLKDVTKILSTNLIIFFVQILGNQYPVEVYHESGLSQMDLGNFL